MHEHHLRITLATVTGTSLLRWLATLGDDKLRYDVPIDLVETRVYLCHVVLLRTFPQRNEAEGFRVPTVVVAEDKQ